MNRKELNEKRKSLQETYRKLLLNDEENHFEDFDFIDHLIMTIDFLEWEIKDYRDKENYNNWVLAGGITRPRDKLFTKIIREENENE